VWRGILDTLANVNARRAIGAEVEPVAEHAGKGNRRDRRVLVALEFRR